MGAGVAGGLVGGLFSASGPIMGWFNYRQPLVVSAIRATLLCGFVLTTSMRTLVVGIQGGLTAEVWLLTALGLPLVVLGTWIGSKLLHRVNEVWFTRIYKGVLSLIAVHLLIRSALTLGG